MGERIFIGIFPSLLTLLHASMRGLASKNLKYRDEHKPDVSVRRRCEKVDSTETSRAASRYVERVQREFFSLSPSCNSHSSLLLFLVLPQPPLQPFKIQLRENFSPNAHTLSSSLLLLDIPEWMNDFSRPESSSGAFEMLSMRQAAAAFGRELICRAETTTTKWKPHTIRKTFSLDLGENSVCVADVVQEL